MKLELTRRIKKKVLIYRHNLYYFKCLKGFYTRGTCKDFLYPVFFNKYFVENLL